MNKNYLITSPEADINDLMKRISERIEGHLDEIMLGGVSIPVIQSDRVPPDTIYLVSQKSEPLRFNFTAPPEPQLLTYDMLNQLYRSMAVPRELFEDTYQWERYSLESLSAWGVRLAKRGLLDDMAIRRVYQATVWRELFNLPLRAIRRLRGL